MKKQTVYEIATGRMVALLEAGTPPWKKTWKDQSFGGIAPMNYASKRPYNGINFFLLATAFDEPYFMTFKQVKAAGGNIRKGAKAFPVFFWGWHFLDAKGEKVENEKDAAQKIPFLRYYNVFNSADIECIEFEKPEVPELLPNEKIGRCEALVASTGAAIKPHGSRASYSSFSDEISMPAIGQFGSSENYYSTLFHELGHWTGHASRLARFDGKKADLFGSDSYSREELVAEMTACFLCAHCRIDTPAIQTNQAAYLSGWISTLKGDAKLAVIAASQAQKAADFILQKQQ